MSIIDQINQKLYTQTAKINSVACLSEKRNNTELYQNIISQTSFLPLSSSFAERIYCIKHNITNLQLCAITNKPLLWNACTKTYRTSRGGKGIKKNHTINKQIEINTKVSKTKQANYQKIKQTLSDVYLSNKYTLISREILDTFAEQLLKHSKPHYVNKRTLQTNINELCSLLFYTKHPLIDIHNICWAEILYLYTHNTTPTVCEYDNTTKTKFINYTKGYSQYINRENKSFNKVKEVINEIQKQNYTILSHPTNQLRNSSFTIQCNTCNIICERWFTCGRWQNIGCMNCLQLGKSKQEIEIADFIRSQGEDVVMHTLPFLPNSRKELDIFVPNKQIGIEFHGTLWHSYGKNYPNNIDTENKNMHLEKLNLCNGVNIKLIQVFSNEWETKQDIVKSVILSKLNLIPHKIYARKCTVVNLTYNEKSKFLRENHLQGNDASKIWIGLKYDNQIVAVMTFGKRKITKGSVHLELVRFANKINTTVVGGASKLFKYFIHTYKPQYIVTYADLRYSNGNMYKQLGFTIKHISAPNYWYTQDCVNLQHRMNFQKHKIKDWVGGTEKEKMFNAGYRRIWDCGNMVFEWNSIDY